MRERAMNKILNAIKDINVHVLCTFIALKSYLDLGTM